MAADGPPGSNLAPAMGQPLLETVQSNQDLPVVILHWVQVQSGHFWVCDFAKLVPCAMIFSFLLCENGWLQLSYEGGVGLPGMVLEYVTWNHRDSRWRRHLSHSEQMEVLAFSFSPSLSIALT